MTVDIQSLRNIDLHQILVFLNEHGDLVKKDKFFQPKNRDACRYYVTVQNGRYDGFTNELVVNGMKWLDHTGEAGGGAIDLVMYLKGCNFSAAIALLQRVQAWERRRSTSANVNERQLT